MPQFQEEHLSVNGVDTAVLTAGDGPALEAVYAKAQHARRQWSAAIEAAEAPPTIDSQQG